MSIGPGILLNDRYDILAEMEVGSPERGFRALDLRMGRAVQVRVCPIPNPADTDGFFRLEQRAQALAALQHPNLQLCFDVGMLRRELFLVSEWLEGPSLADLIQDRPLPWAEARPILTQVCEGLLYAHTQGLHHLRLTSRSISIEANGRVVLHAFALLTESSRLDEGADAAAFAALVADSVDSCEGPETFQQVSKSPAWSLEAFRDACGEVHPIPEPAAPRRWGWIAAGLVLAGALGWGLHQIKATPPSTLAIRAFTAVDLDDPALANQLPEQLRQHLLRHPGLRLQPAEAKADLELHGRLAWEPVSLPLTLEDRLAMKPAALLLTLSLWKPRTVAPQWTQTRPMTEAGLRQLEQELDLQLTKEMGQDLVASASKKVRLGTESPEAYQALMRAKYFINERSKVGLEKAERELSEAFRRDPNFAKAHAALAQCLILQMVHGNGNIQELTPRAQAAAERALALDTREAEALCSLGYLRFRFQWDWMGAEKAFQEALALDPENPLTHHWYGFYLCCRGQWEASQRELKAAMALDPLDFQAQTNLGVAYSWSGNLDQGLKEFRKVMALHPQFISAPVRVIFELEARGRLSESLAAIAALSTQNLKLGVGPNFQGIHPAFESGGARAYWQTRLQNHQVLVSKGIGDPFFLAYSLVHLGDLSGAFAVLNQAVDQHSAFMVWIPKDPGLAPLRQDPRFKDLLRRINFPEE